jgi:histidine ammonia-lyase
MSSKAYIVGFGAPSLAEAFKVASGMCVDLDAAAASRMKKESPAPKSFEPENTPTGQIMSENAPISRECVRAALFFKLNNLVNGKSKCRPSVAEAICTLLNSDVVPRIPMYKTDKECLGIVADAMHGVGCSMAQGEAIQSVFVEKGMDVPKLSSDERLIIEDGQSMSAGIGSVCIEGGKTVLMFSTLIAALSAEALKAEVRFCFLDRE